MKKITIALTILTVFSFGVYLSNASWRASTEKDELKFPSHRGIHQTYHREGLTNDTCTAKRIDALKHSYMENTIPSMQAAFDAGADVVELDVHPTTNGYFAVFHDWTLDCRTDGSGVTRSHDMAHLKTLDLGHGYTADDGKTFPLREKGIALMPELSEIFTHFPDKHFLINFKSNQSTEGDLLAAYIKHNPEWRKAIWGVYGGDEPTWRAKELIGGNLKSFTRTSTKKCILRYIALGWTGYIPEACRNTLIMVPIDIAPWLWGWPNLLVERLANVNSEIALLGPMKEDHGSGAPAIDTLENLELVPEGFSGYIWTNKIEVLGPVIKNQDVTVE